MDIAQDYFFAQQALTALFSVANKLQVQGDKYLQDLTLRQILAIPAIVHAPDGKATINHIARYLGTTKQSAKQIVDAMEKKNYLSVAPSKRDKRAVDITITPEGELAFAECSERTDVFLADLFREFNAEELRMLCVFLHKMYRFDGADQDNLSISYDEGDAEGILQHHQKFMERRVNKHE